MDLKFNRLVEIPKKVFLLGLFICAVSCRKDKLEETIPNINGKDKSAARTSSVADFTIAVIPDTQYQVSSQFGGLPAMFTAQIDWIKANQAAENIQYVVSLGDITDHGDDYTSEWTNASTYGYYKLESQAGFTNGIPYGTCVGNHDQSPNTGHPLTCSTAKYNTYFGANRFRPRAYYGENYAGTGSNNNDSHYDLFTAGGVNWIVIYVEYDSHGDDGANMNTWAYNLLGTYSTRKAIIVSHMGLETGNPAPWATTGSTYEQAHVLYDRIKPRKNVVMMLSGHWTGEGYRQDTYAGNTIRSYMSDYQNWTNGGNGYMRLIKISLDNFTISTKTYSPYLNTWQTDSDSQFTDPVFTEERTTRNCDFNQDGATDRACFNSTTGVWKTYGLSDVTWGIAGDIAAPADFNGDGKTDRAVFRPSNGTWSVEGIISNYQWGLNGDIPIPGDYNGIGRAYAAVYRPSTFEWWIDQSSPVVWGIAGDIPVPGDYNGDGKVDIAMYRPPNPTDGTWFLKGISTTIWGMPGDIPVPGDYNGDGSTDIAVWRPSNATWYLKGIATTAFGMSGDIPVPGDYNKDGKTDLAVWRPSTNECLVMGQSTTVTGDSSFKPLGLPYHIRKFFFP